MLTQERLKELLSYDPVTGDFTWLVDRKGVRAGDRAGGVCPLGYVSLQVDRKRYLAHRLAWLYVNGAWPAGMIDHKDRNRSNNVFSNLREATYAENNINSPARPNNALGIKGVHRLKYPNRPFLAQIKINGDVKRIGRFDTAEEAGAAYQAAARMHFGEFAA